MYKCYLMQMNLQVLFNERTIIILQVLATSLLQNKCIQKGFQNVSIHKTQKPF
jgi:hypothetical protein